MALDSTVTRSANSWTGFGFELVLRPLFAVTLDAYSHVLPQADAEAASQIAALLEARE